MQSIDDLPLVAMADSGPFFDAKDSPLPGLLARLARPPAQLRAAYLGTANGDNEDLDSDQRLREWGWDPVKNEPSVAPATMVRRSAENTDRRFADTLDGSPADAPFGTAQPRRHF